VRIGIAGGSCLAAVATTLGCNIRAARKAAGLSQRQLAQSLEADSALVSKWERGIRRPSDANLVALGEQLRRSLGWFYTDHDDERVAA
jgi:transcriptional regulator with XRE-family HTH domain